MDFFLFFFNLALKQKKALCIYVEESGEESVKVPFIKVPFIKEIVKDKKR